MDENKKSKAGMSIGIVIIIVIIGFCAVIGLTQLGSTKNLGKGQENNPYADFIFNENGVLVAYLGDEDEVVIPATYSMSATPSTKEMSSTSISELQNMASRLGISGYTISAKQETINNGYEMYITTNYTMTFKYKSAVAGGDITTRSIQSNVFGGNTQLKKVILPATIQSIGSGCFEGCTKLEEINLPDSISNIGSYAFQNCDGLKELTLPANLQTIQNGTFYDCTNLEKVVMGDSVYIIWSQAFYNCINLKEVTFSNNLTQIETNAFYNCTKLEEVRLPATMTYIAHRSFYNCSKLNTIIVEAVSVPSGDSSMFPTNANLKIYVPDESWAEYYNMYPWYNYQSKLYKMSELPTEEPDASTQVVEPAVLY